jgi:Family of unknown function (DUF6364)
MRTKITLTFEDQLMADVSEIARREHVSVRAIIRRFLHDLAKSAHKPSAKDLPQVQSVPEKSDRSYQA